MSGNAVISRACGLVIMSILRGHMNIHKRGNAVNYCGATDKDIFIIYSFIFIFILNGNAETGRARPLPQDRNTARTGASCTPNAPRYTINSLHNMPY